MSEIKQGYKQTKVGIIPEDWEVVKVGEVCDCIVPGRNKPENFDGDIPWVTTPDIMGKYISDTKSQLYISAEEAKKVGSKIIPKNSVIMSCVGELGLLSIVKNEIVINQQLHAFLPSSKIQTEFLHYALNTQKKYMDSVATKTAVPYMNKDNCNSIPVPLPPLKEQEKIAEILTTWDEAITKQTELLRAKKLQKKALMQKLLSGEVRFDGFDDEWEEVRLGEIVKKMQSGGTPKADNQEFYNGNIPFVKVNDITSSGKYLIKTESSITEKGLKNSSAWIVPINSIIYSMYASVGFLSINTIEVATSQAMINIILDLEKANLEYIYYHLLDFKKNVHTYVETGTQGNLNAQTVRNLKIKLPSLPEQQKIAEVLSLADDEINLLKNELIELKQQKKALMQKLLTGQVRVKV